MKDKIKTPTGPVMLTLSQKQVEMIGKEEWIHVVKLMFRSPLVDHVTITMTDGEKVRIVRKD